MSRGLRVNKKGKHFEFTLITNQENDIRLRTAAIIKRQLQKVGIVVNIKPMKFQTLVEEVHKPNFEAVLLGWEMGPDPDDQYAIWQSPERNPKESNVIQWDNFINYANDDVDDCLKTGQREP